MNNKKAAIIAIIMITATALALEAISDTPKAKVSFALDDSDITLYENAYPLFEKHDAKATLFVITGLEEFENRPIMTEEMIKETSDLFEIASHTVTHQDLTTLDDTEKEKELKESKEALESQGYNIVGLSIPYGAYDDDTEELAKKYYTYTRPTIWGTNNETFDPYALKSKWVKDTTTLAEMESWVDDAKNESTWLIIMLHSVEETPTTEYSIKTSDLDALIAYIDENSIEITTIGEEIEKRKRTP